MDQRNLSITSIRDRDASEEHRADRLLGVTIEIRGRGIRSGRAGGGGDISTVRGQPSLPAGGGGRSASIGQCMDIFG